MAARVGLDSLAYPVPIFRGGDEIGTGYARLRFRVVQKLKVIIENTKRPQRPVTC